MARKEEDNGKTPGRPMTKSQKAKHYLLIFAKITVPFGISALFIFMLYALLDWDVFTVVGSAITAYFFPPAGKESVIPITVNLLHQNYGMGAFASITITAGVIAFTDIIVGLFMCWNFDLVEKVPLLGTLLRKIIKKGHKVVEERTWIGRMALVGVALFIIFPFQGSGGVGGTVLGRIIGLDKYKVWGAIIAGALVGCFLIATLSYYLGGAIIKAMKQGTEVALMVITVAALAIIVWYIISRRRDSLKKEKEA